jgi:cell fate regulator YaaT (PSP1 superfamily)
MVARTPEYLVSYGKTGVLGRFLAAAPAVYRRGDRVVVQGGRGLSIGTVLCEATERHMRVLAAAQEGTLLRRVLAEDQQAERDGRRVAEQIFADCRRLAAEMRLPLEVLDVEMSLDGRRAILQYLAGAGCEATALLDQLAARHGVQVWMENLAAPKHEDVEEAGGCGKPDCGRSSGGCSTCGSGGGCSSCGSSKVDMRDYFAHLRDQMDRRSRTPLL